MGTFAGGLSRTGLITVVITLIGVFDGILDNIMFYKMHDLINNKKRLYSWIKFPKIKCALLVHILLSVWNDKHLRNVYFISGYFVHRKYAFCWWIRNFLNRWLFVKQISTHSIIYNYFIIELDRWNCLNNEHVWHIQISSKTIITSLVTARYFFGTPYKQKSPTRNTHNWRYKALTLKLFMPYPEYSSS